MKIQLIDLELIATRLSEDLNFLSGRKIFLTGGTGFFGKWILEAIKYLNSTRDVKISVTILSRNIQRFREECPGLYEHHYFNFRNGDVRNFEFFNAAFDYCIHAATDASVVLNNENPALMFDTIMRGAERVAHFCELTGVNRLLYTSSGAAYGPQPSEIRNLPETYLFNSNFNNKDAYALAKRESETLFKGLKCFETVVARCFAFSGPHLPLNGTFAFGNFIKDALDGRQIVIKGDGLAVRSYLYAADLVIWLFRALIIGRNHEVYNIGSPVAISIAELATRVTRISNINAEPLILGQAQSGVSRYVPDVEKARKELGVDVYTSVDESISRTLKFYRI